MLSGELSLGESSCQPHFEPRVCPLSGAPAKREAAVMAASLSFPTTSLSGSALRSMLSTERDPHRRQRELVRASLVICPGAPVRRRDA